MSKYNTKSNIVYRKITDSQVYFLQWVYNKKKNEIEQNVLNLIHKILVIDNKMYNINKRKNKNVLNELRDRYKDEYRKRLK